MSRRSRKYRTWRCGSLISQETVLSFQVVFVSSGCAGLLVAWSRLAAVDSIQQCVWAEFVCLCVWAEQSSVFEQSEPRNADFVHTVRCQFALSQAAVLCSGLALYLWKKCFIHDDGRVGPWFCGCAQENSFPVVCFVYYTFHTDLLSCPSLPNFLPSSLFLSARSGKKYDA